MRPSARSCDGDGDLAHKLKEVQHRVEVLEMRLNTLMKGVDEVKVSVEVPRVILERKPVYVKVSERELLGRIILLALDGFLDDWRSAGAVASELLRRGWAPKDFKHVRPILEQLVSLGILERVKGYKRGRGRRARWLYRSSPELPRRVEVRDELR